MDVALDTNAISAYFGGDKAVASAIRNASSVLMFPFVVGELEAGFRGGNRYEANKKVLKSFLSEPNVRIIQMTLRTSELFGELKDSLRKAGTFCQRRGSMRIDGVPQCALTWGLSAH